MKLVVALDGNALAKRGETLDVAAIGQLDDTSALVAGARGTIVRPG